LVNALADDKVLQLVNCPLMVPDDDPRKGGIDVVGWAEAIVDIVEDLHRQESSKLGTMREDHR
jgi:hypothetical protein